MQAQCCEAITTSSPRRESLVTQLVQRVQMSIQQRRARRIDRDAFSHLTRLDDSMLRDIGVTRADVQWAMNLPLSQNASDALQLVARGHKKRQ